MGYRLVADLAMVVHFGFLVFVALGGFVALWRRWVLWPHVVAVVWGFSTVLLSWPCPLTSLENWGRERSRGARLSGTGFIDHYIEGVIYPDEHTRLLQALVLLVVIASWVAVARRWAPGRPTRRSVTARRDLRRSAGGGGSAP